MSFISKWLGGDKNKRMAKSPADSMQATHKGQQSFPGPRQASAKYGESMAGATDYNTRKKEDKIARSMSKEDAKKYYESERQKRIAKTASTQKKVKQNKAKSDYKEAPLGGKQTKDGFYPAYKKKSKTAGSFRKAFAAARKAGKTEFTWKNRKYNTKVK